MLRLVLSILQSTLDSRILKVESSRRMKIGKKSRWNNRELRDSLRLRNRRDREELLKSYRKKKKMRKC